MKFLKKTYMQRALREEAKGNYKQAAAFYSKAEEFEKVGEMHELLGDMAQSLSTRIREYQQAIRWYKQTQHTEQAAKKLAELMEIEIRADAKVSAVERHRLITVAEYYAQAKQWEKAGNIYEELRMFDKATEMYIQGGEVERVERISERREDHDQRTYSAQQYFDEAESLYRCGHRDKAHQLLKQCLATDSKHQKATNLFGTLERNLHTHGRRRVHISGEEKEYLLLGKNAATIGRQDNNDIVLLHTDISRNHARIGFQGQTCLIEDLKSSNGTRLNGLRIQKSASLHNRDVVGIGASAQLEVHLRRHAAGISALLIPVDAQIVHKQYLLFSGEMHIGSGKECDLPLQHILTPGAECQFKVKYQQPYWYLYVHPRLADVEFNGVPVKKYVVLFSGDSLRFTGMTLLFD